MVRSVDAQRRGGSIPRHNIDNRIAPLAQLDRAPVFGTGNREFESCMGLQ